MGESKSHGLIRIVMIGTAPETKGGVASVIRVYEKVGLFDEWPITYLASHADGGFFRKLSKATIAFSGFLFQLIFRRDFVLHVHSASRASFWRKAAFIYPCLWMGTPVIFHLHGGGFMHFYHDECGPFSRSIIRNVLNRSAKIAFRELARVGVCTYGQF